MYQDSHCTLALEFSCFHFQHFQLRRITVGLGTSIRNSNSRALSKRASALPDLMRR